ncbi:C40 family peptidase [Paenibacillus stellifer]|uniref:C40 family peptidase n=1 Tax=Paenibacillus stellifer TaxID=169760 RepID=UPI00068A015C|nr:C40 family peptidase [Paenibacillus stellifer]
MKKIKMSTVARDIKQLDKLPKVMERVKRSSVRAKRQADHDKAHAQTPVAYAQHRSESTMKKMVRTQMGMSMSVSSRLIRHIQKKQTLPIGDTVSGNTPVDTNPEPSVTPTSRQARRLRLYKPIDGKYLLRSDQRSGKQRFIRSRANARLSHRSRKDRILDLVSKRDVKPARKKTRAAAPSHTANVRAPRRNALVSEIAGQTIKRKERTFKTLSPFIKTGQRLGQAQKADRAEPKMNAVETAKRAAQMAMTTRRTLQRAQAAARLNLRIIKMVVKAAAMLVKGLTALLGISSTVIVLLCIVMAIAAVISSPFGIFVSGENTDADVKPLSRIVQEMDAEFESKLEEIQQSAGNVDRVEIHYTDSADNTRIDNWADIIAVFAVKTVMDTENGMDVVTLDATRIGIIHEVFWEINQVESHVETIEHTEMVTVQHEDGSSSKETTTTYERILHITVNSRTAERQAEAYHFTNEQMDLMKEMLSAEFRPMMFAILGKEADSGLTPEQLELVQQHLLEGELGSEAVKLALTRLGDPYSQPKAGQDNFTDCSYLVQWVYRQLGIEQPRTAAEQARFCVENDLAVSAADLIPGDLVFWSYERNGRFMDITHVGIYAGDGKVVDASSSRGQVVYRTLFDADKQVLFGRPQLASEK